MLVLMIENRRRHDADNLELLGPWLAQLNPYLSEVVVYVEEM